MIVSSRRREKLEQVTGDCQLSTNTTQKVSIVPYNALDANATLATVDRALSAAAAAGDSSSNNNNPHIDLVFLNAGVFQSQPAMQTTQAERERIWRTNFVAPVDLADALLQRQRQHHDDNNHNTKTTHLVIVSSIMSHGPHALSSTYGATKAALRNYFHSLAMEEGSWLRIDVACPASTATSLWNSLPYNNNKESSTSTNTIDPTTGSALSADRVAELIVSGVTGPYWLFYETWIGIFPSLIWVWMSHYTPNLFMAFCYLLAYIRVPVWQHEGLDAMDVPILLDRLVAIALGNYPPTAGE